MIFFKKIPGSPHFARDDVDVSFNIISNYHIHMILFFIQMN